MTTYKEYQYVQRCLQIIEDKLGWGSSKAWHNDVFIELSDKIQQQTQVLLSPTTLKRVWGRVNYNNAPSISTLNTLAQFAGYTNWRDFKNSGTNRKPSWFARKITPNFGIIVGSAAAMTLVFISLYSMRSTTPMVKPDYSAISFSSRPITAGLPNSVVFDFNIEEVESDSIYIQQFWDPTKTIKIKKEQKQATGQYYYPGYFRAKLLIDGELIKEHDLFIKSNGWLGTVDYEPIPKYIKTADILSNKLAYSNSVINEIKASDKPLMSSFHYVNDLPAISGDNFELTTSIKNVYSDKWAVCQRSSIVIVGTKSAFIVPFAIPGCVSELGVMLSDVYIDGKKHDLSAFGTDLSSFRNIKISSKDRELTVFIDDNIIFSHQYNETIGNIVGIRFRFLGAGEVDYLKLKDAKSIVFDDNFSLNSLQ